jgi:hypothetical protein
MDHEQFDRFARMVSDRVSRRGVLKGLAGLAGTGIKTWFRPTSAAAACAPGLTDCGLLLDGKYCYDLQSDPNNCGSCSHPCGSDQYCLGGACFDLIPACVAPLTPCGNSCVDLQTDTYHCGVCGNACVGVPGPGQSSIGACVNGQCTIVCEPGYYDCGQGCSDLLFDTANCGSCGNACPQGQLCQNGSCVATCPPDLTDCNGVCVDGGSDPNNCGACGRTCANQGGFGICCFGQCVDQTTDPKNCGACENVCGPDQQCIDGSCSGGDRGGCAAGRTACDGTCVDLATDPHHCGACGHGCAGGQRCDGGVCSQSSPPATATAPPPPAVDKWKLWTGTTRLRGAHVLQRRIESDRDDPRLGPGPVGPAYTFANFTRLASLGANYVEVVHPVPLTQNPPFKTYGKLRDNLDRLVDHAYRAGLFVVVGFRNGPGRPERALDAGTICQAGGCLIAGTGGGGDTLWDDEDAQDAWATAWAATARRYRDHPAVVGYDLLIAPDAPALTVWEDLVGRLTKVVRGADPATPLLVGVPSDSTDLLDFRPTTDDRTIYRLDLFPPDRYLTQDPDGTDALTYPGRFDPASDSSEGRFDRAWTEDRTLALEAFARRHELPIAIGAYGVVRWQPGAYGYLTDVLATAEAARLNHGLWVWSPDGWTGADAFDVTRGADADQHEAVPNDLLDAVRATWTMNGEQAPAD